MSIDKFVGYFALAGMCCRPNLISLTFSGAGFVRSGDMFKCDAALPPGIIELGATDVSIGKALDDATAASLARSFLDGVKLGKVSVTGEVSPASAAVLASAALRSRCMVNVSLPGSSCCALLARKSS